MAWPKDATLRNYHLGSDDTVPWLPSTGSTACPGAGAYFDEMFLNKRVGYFMRLVLLYFGSTNLADPANMFHVQPEAISARRRAAGALAAQQGIGTPSPSCA
jgi:hypothetical protein